MFDENGTIPSAIAAEPRGPVVEAGHPVRRSADLASSQAIIERINQIAVRGLVQMYRPAEGRFVHSMRRAHDAQLRQCGVSDRYTAIVLLGLRHLPENTQREVMAGETVTDVCGRLLQSVHVWSDLGDIALLAWAASELKHGDAASAWRRVRALEGFSCQTETVKAAWVLSASVAAGDTVTGDERQTALRRVMAAAGPSGLMHPTTPRRSGLRSHIGCFADQVYPIQALARASVAMNEARALDASDRCARVICELQGDHGQWWWHYDVPAGDVSEGYPVYTVHQDSMAPMALLDLMDAGGANSTKAIELSLRWLDARSETASVMVDETEQVIWRKVGRSDPAKAVRRARAISTRYGLGRLGALDRVFPAQTVEYECRPYHLGWILDTWQKVSM